MVNGFGSKLGIETREVGFVACSVKVEIKVVMGRRNK